MPLLGLFGVSNDGLNLAVNLLVVFLVIVYLALIVWTFLDARRRIEDSWLVACATAASLFPFVGAMVYSILRPPEFIEDRRERELEIRASELRVKHLGEQSCPNCEFPVERTYLRCPNCETRLKDPCPTCSKPVDPRWAMCPYCETPIRRRAPERRQREGRRPKADREPPSRAAREAARAQARAERASKEKREPRPAAKRAKPRAAGTGRKAAPRPSSAGSSGSSAAPGPRPEGSEPAGTRAPSSDSQATAERAAARARSRSDDKAGD